MTRLIHSLTIAELSAIIPKYYQFSNMCTNKPYIFFGSTQVKCNFTNYWELKHSSCLLLHAQDFKCANSRMILHSLSLLANLYSYILEKWGLRKSGIIPELLMRGEIIQRHGFYTNSSMLYDSGWR